MRRKHGSWAVVSVYMIWSKEEILVRTLQAFAKQNECGLGV